VDPYNIFTNTVSNGDTLLSIVVRPVAITSIIISLKHMHSDGLDPSRQLACPPGQNVSMSGAAAAKVPVACDTKSDDIVDPTLAVAAMAVVRILVEYGVRRESFCATS